MYVVNAVTISLCGGLNTWLEAWTGNKIRSQELNDLFSSLIETYGFPGYDAAVGIFGGDALTNHCAFSGKGISLVKSLSIHAVIDSQKRTTGFAKVFYGQA